MTWTKNMSEKTEPQLTSYSEKDYTKITFYPDLKKFHMKEFERVFEFEFINNMEFLANLERHLNILRIYLYFYHFKIRILLT